MHRKIDRQIDRYINRYTDGWKRQVDLDGWIDRQIEKQMDRQIDGQIDPEKTTIHIPHSNQDPASTHTDTAFNMNVESHINSNTSHLYLECTGHSARHSYIYIYRANQTSAHISCSQDATRVRPNARQTAPGRRKRI